MNEYRKTDPAVLPSGRAGTREVVQFIARELSPDSYLNIMSQYRPGEVARHGSPDIRQLLEARYSLSVKF